MQDASATITRKAPTLDAVLGEALPMGGGELRVCGQGTGVHALCRSSVWIRERKDGLISQRAKDLWIDPPKAPEKEAL